MTSVVDLVENLCLVPFHPAAILEDLAANLLKLGPHIDPVRTRIDR